MSSVKYEQQEIPYVLSAENLQNYRKNGFWVNSSFKESSAITTQDLCKSVLGCSDDYLWSIVHHDHDRETVKC